MCVFRGCFAPSPVRFPCVENIWSNLRPPQLGLATAAACHAGQHCHEQDDHCGRANKNSIITSSLLKNTVVIESGDSHMKVKRTQKAPSSTALALGRPCSLTHTLLRRPSISSLASILVWNEVEAFTVKRSLSVGVLTQAHNFLLFVCEHDKVLFNMQVFYWRAVHKC